MERIAFLCAAHVRAALVLVLHRSFQSTLSSVGEIDTHDFEFQCYEFLCLLFYESKCYKSHIFINSNSLRNQIIRESLIPKLVLHVIGVGILASFHFTCFLLTPHKNSKKLTGNAFE